MPQTPAGDGAARAADLVPPSDPSADRLGIAIVGLGGAVATTAVAGMELVRAGHAGLDGLPLATLPEAQSAGLADYGGLVFGGWDLYDGDLAAAARHHSVLDLGQYEATREALSQITPWPAYGNDAFCRGVTGEHCQDADLGLRESVDALRADLRQFKQSNGLDRAVVINLASTESWPDLDADVFQTPDAFEAAIDADDEQVPPAMLYAYAAILEGCPYGNFTPSVGADVPALVELAEREGVPLAGKDGKTGQTFIKTLMAPGLRDRALRVEGWFSTNILGNRDGEALREAGSLASKIGTKGSVLDQILGYPVEDHVVKINYYRPPRRRQGGVGQRRPGRVLGPEDAAQDQLSLQGLDPGRAARAIEIARCLDLAQRAGRGGVQEPMGVFFKGPMTAEAATRVPEHDFGKQQTAFAEWLDGLAESERVGTRRPRDGGRAPRRRARRLRPAGGPAPPGPRPQARPRPPLTAVARRAAVRPRLGAAGGRRGAGGRRPERGRRRRRRPSGWRDSTPKRCASTASPSRRPSTSWAKRSTTSRVRWTPGCTGACGPRWARSRRTPATDDAEPPFVDALVSQPRAGATHPGLPRLLLEPAESHGDHCFAVAVFGVLLAPRFGADPAAVFLTGLAHHLFNATLPDAGYAADELIGADRLAAMTDAATEDALDALDGPLRETVRQSLATTQRERFGTPEARAFHAADVLDRVLEMEWHEASARFRLADALGRDTDAGQLDICHPGFYQSFQQDVLSRAGVWEPDSGTADRDRSPSGSYERGGHGAVPAASPLAGGPGAEDGRQLDDGTEIARLERREMGS